MTSPGLSEGDQPDGRVQDPETAGIEGDDVLFAAADRRDDLVLR